MAVLPLLEARQGPPVTGPAGAEEDGAADDGCRAWEVAVEDAADTDEDRACADVDPADEDEMPALEPPCEVTLKDDVPLTTAVDVPLPTEDVAPLTEELNASEVTDDVASAEVLTVFVWDEDVWASPEPASWSWAGVGGQPLQDARSSTRGIARVVMALPGDGWRGVF